MQCIESSLEGYRSLFENAVEGIFQSRPDGTYIQVNPSLAAMYGYDSPDELMESVRDISTQLYVTPTRRGDFMRQIESRGTVTHFESEIRRKDGSRRWISENARAVTGKDGGLLYYEGFVRDITDRLQSERQLRTLESELRHAERVSALGALAAGVTHDFKTILTVIDGSAELALARAGDDDELRSLLTRIGWVSERGLKLIGRLSRFGQSPGDVNEPVDVEAVAREVLRLLRPAMPRELRVSLVEGAKARRVLADPSQIFQVILNLCSNAIQAISESGSHLQVVIAAEDADLLRLSVIDDGPGMDRKTVENIFDPTFTTRERIGGTGVGLSVVHGVVDCLGGTIRVDSTPGQGTRFDVLLPARTASPGNAFVQRVSSGVKKALGTRHA